MEDQVETIKGKPLRADELMRMDAVNIGHAVSEYIRNAVDRQQRVSRQQVEALMGKALDYLDAADGISDLESDLARSVRVFDTSKLLLRTDPANDNATAA